MLTGISSLQVSLIIALLLSLCDYSDRLLEQRNFVLKQGNVSLLKNVIAELHGSVDIEAIVTVKVTRGSWRSKLRYLPQDILADLKQEMEKIRRGLRRRRPKRQPTAAMITEHMYFVEEPWDKEPAIDLLNRYLERLQLLVDNAVKQLGEPL